LLIWKSRRLQSSVWFIAIDPTVEMNEAISRVIKPIEAPSQAKYLKFSYGLLINLVNIRIDWCLNLLWVDGVTVIFWVSFFFQSLIYVRALMFRIQINV
jgi:hypothetical protein